jgi:SH3-like domain-containing protein
MTGRAWPALLHVALVAALVAAAPAGGAMAQDGDAGAFGPVTRLPLPRYVSVRAESANARRGPGLDHRVDWEYRLRGMPLRVVGEYGQWRQVQDPDGAGGWVHHSLLSGTRTVLVLGETPLVLHAGPGDGTAVRAMAEPGVIAWLDSCRAEWCAIRASGFRGWVPRERLWGVDPEESIE